MPIFISQITWEDVRDIMTISEDVEVVQTRRPREYYQEILDRFVESRTFRKDLTPCELRYKVVLAAAEAVVGFRLGKARTSVNTDIRAVVSKILRTEGYSLSEVGDSINRDHSTVHALVKRMDEVLALPESYRGLYDMYMKTKEALK